MGHYCEKNIVTPVERDVQIIEIAALPPVLPPSLMTNIFTDCLHRRISAEICLMRKDSRTHMLLVGRTDGSGTIEAVQRLRETFSQISSYLEGAGFRIMEPAGDIVESLSPRSYTAGALFYPKETQGEYYIPASWGSLKQLDWAEISSTLYREDDVLFFVQLIPTFAEKTEKSMIAQNLSFFESLRVSEPSGAAEAACSAYARLKGQTDEALFFVNTGVLGMRDVCRRIQLVLERGGAESIFLSKSILGHIRFLSEAPYVFADELAVYGHIQGVQLQDSMRRLSHLADLETMAAFAALPRRAERIQGVQIGRIIRQTQPLPELMSDENGILIGSVSEESKVYMPVNWLPLHMAIIGMPGMGKSTFSIGLLHQIYQKQLPFLIIEPTKTEYRRLIDAVPELQIYTVGRVDLMPLYMNPFLPPKGVTLEQYKPSLTTIFTAAFSMTSPLDVIFPDVIDECYTRYGWRNTSTRDSEGVRIFGLHEFICVFKESIQRSNYDSESKMNLQSGGAYRLQALLNANPVLFDTEKSVDYEELLEHPSLIELDAVDNAEQKALIMSIILINLMLVIRKKQATDGIIKNVVMVDEAHLLLGQHMGSANTESAKSGQSIVQLLHNLVVTIRAYGTGLIFADQSARKLTDEIVSNCNFKVLFRLENMEERRAMAHEMGLTEDMIADVRRTDPGEAYISCSKLNAPLKTATPRADKLLKLRDNITDQELKDTQRGAMRETPFARCSKCSRCVSGCDYACRVEAEFLARTICAKVEAALHEEEGLRTVVDGRKDLIGSAIDSMTKGSFDRQQLLFCTDLHLLRRLRSVSSCGSAWIEEID